MNTPLRIALSYFSFVPLQRWLNWIFGGLLGFGLLVVLVTDSSSARFGCLVFSTVFALIVAAAPAFAGGAAMRIASTPSVMHLRPHGRRQMLVGATLTITLIAMLMALPLLVFQLAGGNLSIKGIEFTTPALSMFQLVWGCIALAWVVVFAISAYQTLVPLSFLILIVIAGAAVRLATSLSITADQFATSACVTGVIAWIAFAVWHVNAASVLRPGALAAWTNTQPFLERLQANSRWFSARDSVKVSRPIALFQYLVGNGSVWTQVQLGGFIAAMLLLLPKLFSAFHPALQSALEPARSPYQLSGLSLVMMIVSTVVGPQIGRRSRILWLRAGLDRAGLFAAVERHAQLAMLATLSIPLLLLVTLSLAQRPDLALNILLFAALQMTFAMCFLYTGLTATRAGKAGIIMACSGLLIISIVMSRSMEPDNELSARAHLVALAIICTLALGLRWIARRKWLVLDWRVAAPPLPTQGMR